jgi:hypothetical protein
MLVEEKSCFCNNDGIDGIMDILGVFYPQYGFQPYVEECFWKHLKVIKTTYCHPKKWALYLGT